MSLHKAVLFLYHPKCIHHSPETSQRKPSRCYSSDYNHDNSCYAFDAWSVCSWMRPHHHTCITGVDSGPAKPHHSSGFHSLCPKFAALPDTQTTSSVDHFFCWPLQHYYSFTEQHADSCEVVWEVFKYQNQIRWLTLRPAQSTNYWFSVILHLSGNGLTLMI